MMRTLEGVEDMRVATLEVGTTINFAGYIGHTPFRLWVLGDDAHEREATDDAIVVMTGIVREAIAADALRSSMTSLGG